MSNVIRSCGAVRDEMDDVANVANALDDVLALQDHINKIEVDNMKLRAQLEHAHKLLDQLQEHVLYDASYKKHRGRDGWMHRLYITVKHMQKKWSCGIFERKSVINNDLYEAHPKG